MQGIYVNRATVMVIAIYIWYIPRYTQCFGRVSAGGFQILRKAAVRDSDHVI